MKNENKKLDELLRQFMDDGHIHDLKEDLSFADRLFTAYPVPVVQQGVKASIQAKVRRKLKQQRYLAARKWIATAAAILMAVLLSREYFFNTESVTKHSPSFSREVDNTDNFWDDEFYVVNSQDDPIERELFEITNSIRAVSLDTYEATDTFSIDMMELEEMEYLTDKASFGKDNFYVQ